jgi:cyclic pyranopterin monophosphate synthase
MAPRGPFDGGSPDDASRAERRRAAQVGRPARPRMTDVTHAPGVYRRAVAEAEVKVSHETLSSIVDGTVPRGDVLGVAELAGVMAGKKTADLIPLVHPAALTELLVNAVPDRSASAVRIKAECGLVGSSGVEMEALTASAIAALTLYDMIRDVDPGAEIVAVRLVSASGAEAGEWVRSPSPADRAKPQRATRMAGRIGAGRPDSTPGSHRRHNP